MIQPTGTATLPNDGALTMYKFLVLFTYELRLTFCRHASLLRFRLPQDSFSFEFFTLISYHLFAKFASVREFVEVRREPSHDNTLMIKMEEWGSYNVLLLGIIKTWNYIVFVRFYVFYMILYFLLCFSISLQ